MTNYILDHIPFHIDLPALLKEAHLKENSPLVDDFTRMAELMEEKAIFDGRNIYDPSEIKKAGFVYYGIGRR